MKHTHSILLRSLTIACLVASCFFAAIPARAQVQTEAAPAMSAYNSAFLVQSGGQTYYTVNYQNGTVGNVQWGWGQDQDLYVLLDRYQYTHAQSDYNLMNADLESMLTSQTWDSANGGYITQDFPPNEDGWNDDIGWTTAAYALGYKYTGNAAYLTEAENSWNYVMSNRDGAGGGWNSSANPQGGIPEVSTAGSGSCALANSNYVYSGVWLYEATGNVAYLNGAEAVYAWERKTLVNTTGSTIDESGGTNWLSWQVIGCTTSPTNTITNYYDDNVYNSGGMIYAATELYRVTGTQQYYTDAVNLINHIYGEYQSNPIAADNGESSTYNDGGYQPENYVFTRAVSNFLTISNGWWSSEYAPWLLANAQDAWNDRDSVNLTWNIWNTVIPSTSDAQSMDESSAAAIWQHLPPPTMNLVGTYEIQNVNSGLALEVSGGSTTSDAAIVQEPFASGNNAYLWKINASAGSGGYYQIENVNSGQCLNVSGASGINGAKIVQYPCQSMIPGNDQWMPVQNPDGTFSFYNLLSYQAVDIPGASTASGVQLDQWFGNGTTAQKFNLIQPSITFSGNYEIQNTNSGLALDVSGASTTENAPVIQYAFNDQKNQLWNFVAADPGYYRIKNVNSGLYLNVTGANTNMGSLLVQWPSVTTYNDQWRPVLNSNGSYSFYSALSAQAIDVPGASTASGVQLDQWGENGTVAQTFNLSTH
jgi:Ricin-type beta-trefoil lectin domain-like/Glycosyl hydrolase family 76